MLDKRREFTKRFLENVTAISNLKKIETLDIFDRKRVNKCYEGLKLY